MTDTLLPKNDEAHLRQKIREMFQGPTKCMWRPSDYDVYPQESYEDDIIALIHARDTKMLEYVIGADEARRFDEEDSYCDACGFERTDGSDECLCVIRNKVRQAQRKRAKQWLGESK